MDVSARPATTDDLADLVTLYRGLEAEMAGLEAIWPRADGLAEPADRAFSDLLADPASMVAMGTIDGVAFGFLVGLAIPLPPQAGGAEIGSIRYVYTDPEAREVGVGEAMLEWFLAAQRSRGVTLFDAHVTPGHRLTKNFFESHGFSARSIVMHHDDGDG